MADKSSSVIVDITACPNIQTIKSYRNPKARYKVTTKDYDLDIVGISKAVGIKQSTKLSERLRALGHDVSPQTINKAKRSGRSYISMDLLFGLVHLCQIEGLDFRNYMSVNRVSLGAICEGLVAMPISAPTLVVKEETLIDEEGNEILDDDDWFASPEWVTEMSSRQK